MSLIDIKSAVETLTPEELTDLATYIRDRDEAAWDQQLDRDAAPGGKLASVLAEVRADIRAGRLEELP